MMTCISVAVRSVLFRQCCFRHHSLIHCIFVLLVPRQLFVCSCYVRGLSFHLGLPLLLPGPRSLDSSGAEYQFRRGSVYQ